MKKNVLEWIVFVVSAILIAVMVIVLVASAVRSGKEPPVLEIETGAAVRVADAFRVPVHVRNRGDETAEEVRVEVSLMNGDQALEESELTVMFVPRKSSREGWVTFRRDPGCCRVVARAVGFNRP